MANKKRSVQGNGVRDVAHIANIEFNEVSGAQKQIDVGPKLKAMQVAGAGTVNATAGVALPAAGLSFAIYNNSATVGAVSFGETANPPTAPTPGSIDANSNVGIPCTPNAWTYLSAGDAVFIRSSAATLLVYIIDDQTTLVKS